MFRPRAFRTFVRGAKIILMFLLIGFELVPNISGGDVHYTSQAALQLTRSQVLINAAYTLLYRPTPEKMQAQRDLQNVLPLFEQEQNLLLANSAENVQALLQVAQSDYLPMIAALQSILNHPNAMENPIETNIVVIHERYYFLTMNELMSALIQSVNAQNLQLFMLLLAIEMMFLLLFFIALTTLKLDITVPVNAVGNVPVNVDVNVPVNVDVDVPVNVDVDVPVHANGNVPVDVDVDVPVNADVDVPVNVDVDVPVNTDRNEQKK